jgi:hypothetical protein
MRVLIVCTDEANAAELPPVAQGDLARIESRHAPIQKDVLVYYSI